MTKFIRSSSHPYTVITPSTPLADLEQFLQDKIFALGNYPFHRSSSTTHAREVPAHAPSCRALPKHLDQALLLQPAVIADLLQQVHHAHILPCVQDLRGLQHRQRR